MEKQNVIMELDFEKSTDLIEAAPRGQYPRTRPAYLLVIWDETGPAEITTYIGTPNETPANVFENRAEQFRLPANVDATALGKFVDGEIVDLIIKINNRYTTNYTGRKGIFPDAIDDDMQHLAHKIYNDAPTLIDGGGLWDASEWYDSVTSRPDSDDPGIGSRARIDLYGGDVIEITESTTDDELEDMAATMEYDTAQYHEIVFDETPLEFLEALREDCIQAAMED